jgi:hypothetical protein
MKSSLQSLLRRAAIILLIIAASVALTQFVKRVGKEQPIRDEANKVVATEKTNKPKCTELKCYNDSDCGKKCSCDRPTGSAIGNRVAK